MTQCAGGFQGTEQCELLKRAVVGWLQLLRRKSIGRVGLSHVMRELMPLVMKTRSITDVLAPRRQMVMACADITSWKVEAPLIGW